MANTTDESPIRDRIERLVAEEHRLRESHIGRGLDQEARERLAAVESELDSCWDVLRRRQAGQPEGLSDSEVPDPPNEFP